MQNIVNSLIKKFNEQDQFIKASIYIIGGFLLVLGGYGAGRFIGTIIF